MSGIRALRRDDLPAVCSLYERIARSGSAAPPDALVAYFARTFLDHPWVDEDLPSLVHHDAAGRILGFLGSHPRRARLDGRGLRVACSGPLVAEADQQGVASLLMRHYLAGPQDVTCTDGATDSMRRIWNALGGHTSVGASMTWARFLRPAAVGEFVTTRAGRKHLARGLHAVGPAIDAAARPVLRRVRGALPTEPPTTAHELTVDGLIEQVRGARHLRLHPDYDRPFVEWMFGELDAVTVRGTPVRHAVHDSTGRSLGWYVYFLPEQGVAQVLQIAAHRGRMSDVLGHLLWHADTNGAAAVLGRVEAALIGELVRHRCVVVPTGLYSLVHTEDPVVLGVLGTPGSLLSTLDGASWMGHDVLWRSEAGRTGGRMLVG